ncbi:SIMPL domain-containing protein [Pseudodesulfovibrio sp.]|uniref:SIMPL domain-containing protein n=1 Tax=unclassified Pseudodesulfovibrio TaxID=2661612 RepID=UPI003AFFEAE4
MEKASFTKKLVLTVILAVGFVFGCAVLGQSLITFRSMDRYVTVKGLAEREVPADLAMWPVSYSVSANTLTEMDAALKRDRAKVIAFLQEQGLGDAEIINATPRIDDMQAMNPNRPPEFRYRANAVLTVRSGDIAKVKQAIAASGNLVAKGVLLVQNYEFRPTFAFTGLNAIKPEMIAEATRNARAAAQQFAADSGSHVGAIRRATQGYFSLQDRDQLTPEIKRIRVVTTVDYLLAD